MAEEAQHPSQGPSGGGVAWSALGAGSRDKVDGFLDEQTRLAREQAEVARLQAEDLRREDKLRHWSLRVHHISDVMKLTFELTLAFMALVIVVALCSAIWSAVHDDGVVIDAFKVPADMAGRGLTGDVVASQLLDRLALLQAQTDSSRAPGTYASDWGGAIKVEIPNTGVSIGEAYRYLAAWLGHQTHIGGEVYRTGSGIALTVRSGGNPGVAFEGRENELSSLLQAAAESVYGQTQPFRYAIYLTSHGQNVLEEKILRDLALNGPDSERPWAYTVWAYSAQNADDMEEALRRAHKAVQLAPNLPLALNDLAFFEALIGHDEEELQTARDTLRALGHGGAKLIIPRAAAAITIETSANIAEELGDFREAVTQYEKLSGVTDFEGSQWLARRMGAANLALAHDVTSSRHLLDGGRDADLVSLAITGFGWQLVNFRFAQFEQFVALDDWVAARKDIEAVLSAPEARLPSAISFLRAQSWPWLALARAKTGDIKGAWAEAAKTPLDCYLCLTVRGQIDASDKNWRGAEYWFTRAVAKAPSIPFADTDCGAMLMAKGDFDAAIAKFSAAHEKGPHFADPLEMWGEALIAKNRSDLALAKFEEASKYAPNWGRLHLKWGEALLYTGDKSGAAKQFAIAAHLDLPASDKAVLVRMEAVHG